MANRLPVSITAETTTAMASLLLKIAEFIIDGLRENYVCIAQNSLRYLLTVK
jgi:hypothetical protein